ncbi:hypothetical protein Pan241w_14800 [Gimesia alba]|uniref:HEAT repeat protein n=1 Tax=Gimesia alba TaxID=2527973 RepID=A0A517RC01_9PLAN|nr:HEAT repeat domain-containing protein [Gimesia alba]QDT41419.1 hypothetical protein Pan241w_14800 [Gimesia alba]
MSKETTGDLLIKELHKDPQVFYEKGRSYQLLQEYFKDYNIATLSGLLTDKDPYVKRAAIWIASELGYESRSLITEIFPLANDDEDEYIQSYALEVLTVCAHGEHSERIIHVIEALESKRKLIRLLAMRLIANLTADQIEAGIEYFKSSNSLHVKGLKFLGDCDQLSAKQVLLLIENQEPLNRKYGAILAKCKLQSEPELMTIVAKSLDSDLREFSGSLVA